MSLQFYLNKKPQYSILFPLPNSCRWTFPHLNYSYWFIWVTSSAQIAELNKPFTVSEAFAAIKATGLWLDLICISPLVPWHYAKQSCMWNGNFCIHIQHSEFQLCRVLYAELQSHYLFTDPEVLIFTWYIIPAVFHIMTIDLYTVLLFAFIIVRLARAPVAESKKKKSALNKEHNKGSIWWTALCWNVARFQLQNSNVSCNIL